MSAPFAPTPEGHPPLGAPRLLIVEDDDGDAILVRELLADGLPGAEVDRVASLTEARALAADPVDCVLLDLGLPDAEGTEAVAAMRSVMPSSAIVVLTGADDVERGMRAVASGAQDYLVKGAADEHVLARAVRYAIERLRAQETSRRLFESERQHAENARLQRALLPEPRVQSDDLEVVVRYRPGQDGAWLGGDFYDVVELDDGSVHLVVGDVSGHGADEAAIGVRLRSAWRALTFAGLHCIETLRTLDQVLRTERDSDDLFTTACVLWIAGDRTHGEMVLAGHHPALLLEGEQPRRLGDGRWGPLLGVIDDPTWETIEFDLPSEWSLLVFTDGMFEGRAAPGQRPRLGEEAMTEIVGGLFQAGNAGAALVDALLDDVERRHGEPMPDDIACCLLSRCRDR